MLKDCRFPKLRSLALMYLDAKENELLEFRKACPRLENLFLYCFAHNTGLWETAAASMRAILQMGSVKLSYLYSGFVGSSALDHVDPNNSDHHRVEDFYLREGKNFFTEHAIIDFFDNNDEDAQEQTDKEADDHEKYFEMYH